MKIKDILLTLEEFAPLALQLEWDNSGIQVGNSSVEATGALLTLDVSERSIETAKDLGINLIISHHPLIFAGLKSITGQTPTERIVIEAIRSGITIYACHTNIDTAKGGVSWAMASRLGLMNVIPLCESGLGCVGNLERPMLREEFVSFVKQQYELPFVKINPNSPQKISKVAVMGGSGASEIAEAIYSKADAMITGDLKYHDFQNAEDRLALIDIGHFESEIDVLEIFIDIIQKKYPTFALHTQKISFVEVK